MDEAHLVAALRYLAFNPAPARLAARPEDWPHGGVAAHLVGRDDPLVDVAPALKRVARFADLSELTLQEQMALEGFETKSVNGRPMGAADFISSVERPLGRAVTPGKRGRKSKGAKGEN
ncbi:hypothetical protein IY145_17485 [Methylosinus sp. H3A]|uniref:hypothetical protein n=1 Tax=Methylosinus sp. H3A TaxID=2785786 RepID=UPI0018C23D05|nr:hypothetical protein [Methylosinus sp. H3A]MBG0811160.1 hypothetical protein [Methylosinus sp. H3A]